MTLYHQLVSNYLVGSYSRLYNANVHNTKTFLFSNYEWSVRIHCSRVCTVGCQKLSCFCNFPFIFACAIFFLPYELKGQKIFLNYMRVLFQHTRIVFFRLTNTINIVIQRDEDSCSLGTIIVCFIRYLYIGREFD